MAHFAELDSNNKVVSVQVIPDEWDGREDELSELLKVSFKQTSYNTRAGVHELGGTPFRKNYAGIGYTYDSIRDAFLPPKPSESLVLNENTCKWEYPLPEPKEDGKTYYWSEKIQNWKEYVVND